MWYWAAYGWATAFHLGPPVLTDERWRRQKTTWEMNDERAKGAAYNAAEERARQEARDDF